MQFAELVKNNYGYRLFVDDLPSATVQNGKTHYEYNIPLGFIPEIDNSTNKEPRLKPYKETAVYNHLDIKIKVSPTLKSDLVGSATPKKIDLPMMTFGQNTTFDMPPQELRIVGFEVTPYSIANAWACEPGVDLSKVGPSLLEAD